MREIVTIQVGEFANFIGSHFWNFQDEFLGLASDPESDPIFRNHNLDMDVLYRSVETLQRGFLHTLLPCFRSTSKPTSPLVLDKLQIGFSNKEVIVRVLHFWEARNPTKGGLLMGIELLLIDEKSTVIQAFIAANRIACYETKLKVDVIYKIKNFLIVDNKTNYRVSSHKFILKFTQQTRLDEVTVADHSIARQKFRICSFDEFEKLTDLNQDLYDVIGKLLLINYENFIDPVPTDGTLGAAKCEGKSKIEIHLQLKEGTVVRLFLWENIAANFQKKLTTSAVKPVVLLATTVNPRTFRDGFMLSLSSMSSTRVFFDNNVEPTTEFLTWLGKDVNNSVMVKNFASEVTKSETLTIAELYRFLENDNPQKATFCCIATITDILPHYGWHYIACTKCACKLRRTDSALVCNSCNNNNAVGIVRYRVEISVCDKDNVATFVLFDRDATKLTYMRAADVLDAHLQLQGDDGGAIENQSLIPQCLLDIVGRTYKFQITLTSYNFSDVRQTITVSRIQEEINAANEALEEEVNGGDEAIQEEVNGGDHDNGGDGDNNKGAGQDIDMVSINHKAKRIRRS